MSQKKSRSLIIGISFIALALLVGALGVQCGCGSASVQPEVTGSGNTLDLQTEQTVNNPYPWMWACLGIVLLFLAYSYFSKKYTGWGRK